jgi:ubiquinone/menaquinone biosynthesis C-methylase UbiE
MAASSIDRLDMQLQEYFDQLAPTWDREFTPERLKCLGEIVEGLAIKCADKVLDIGSGTGVLVPFLAAKLGTEGKIVGLDFSMEMLVRAQAKDFPPFVGFARADILAIPVADNCVDLAIANSAFPHFGDQEKALKEIARVLRTNGRLIICHTMSREMLNRLHQSIGGAVANDLLPDEFEVRRLVERARLQMTHFEDGPERYLVIAEKSARYRSTDNCLPLS